ncbi:hypothetical protein [Thiocapsa sp. UBA6158]|uniref:hypothetical protein n=1 Tax=Thiocapsa sp. UBA6158 TaxID=1947692 RepID=UPI0025F42DDC|nr:hypothetical protein [Thiocapsa sp. UBA6158]
MSDHGLVQIPAQSASRAGGADCATLVRLATLGAVVGGSVAAASNLQRVESGDLTATAAVAETGKTAITAAVATAIGGAAASSVAEQGLMRLGIMFAAGTLALYGLQRWAEARGDSHE